MSCSEKFGPVPPHPPLRATLSRKREGERMVVGVLFVLNLATRTYGLEPDELEEL